MPKRKKYPKLPNGYGSISYLGKGRRNPYLVRPPVTEMDDDGKPIMPKAICCTDTWMHGFAVLTAWKAGTYQPGMEKDFKRNEITEAEAIERILSDYVTISKRSDGLTVEEVYKKASEWKLSHKTYSEHYKQAIASGWIHIKPIADMTFADVRTKDLQELIDNCGRKSGTKYQIKNVLNMMYDYALHHDVCTMNYSKGVLFDAKDVRHGQAFTEENLKEFWKDAMHGNVVAKKIVVMCYSGFRISEYAHLEINMIERYFYGGSKTDAGKNRTVPIQKDIYPFVEELLKGRGTLGINTGLFTKQFRAYMDAKNLKGTPHWTRHTFSALCEHYEVKENDRKRLLGHVIGDVTNDVYGHRTLDELRKEIDKIKPPIDLTISG